MHVHTGGMVKSLRLERCAIEQQACLQAREPAPPAALPPRPGALHHRDPHRRTHVQGLREDSGLYLESDTDEQLLIHIPFSSAVKLNSIIVQCKDRADQVRQRAVRQPRASCASPLLPSATPPPFHHAPTLVPDAQAPRRVKLFVNQPTIGFAEASDSAGQAEFELTPAQLAGERLPLKCVEERGWHAFFLLARSRGACPGCGTSSASTWRTSPHVRGPRRPHGHPPAAPSPRSNGAPQPIQPTPTNPPSPPPECRLVKFQRVNTLTIFVEDNTGDAETTVVEKLALFGQAGDTFNVSELKDVSKEQGG